MSTSRPAFKLCVFCGSNPGEIPAYTLAARVLGQALAHRGIGLVYGGASIGVMGALADACLAAGGHVEGVLPEGLFAREVAHTGLSELLVVDSMHARKAAMAARSNAFVALPGGFGTLEELFEVITWAQIGIHQKPIALLNVDGFYDPLLIFIDRLIEAGFVRVEQRGLIQVHTEVNALIDALQRYTPPAIYTRWLEPGQI